MKPATLAAVAVGGCLGSLARWGLGEIFAPMASGNHGTMLLTWATNLTGCLLMGVLSSVLAHRPSPRRITGDPVPVHPLAHSLLGAGFLGGFTTFSAAALDVVTVGQGAPGWAAALMFATMATCVTAVALGRTATTAVLTRRLT